MTTLRFRVEGKVQGVYFRGSTQNEALHKGITGWVRNMSDGSVEGVMQGDEAQLNALTAWLHDGPSFSRVTKVETAPLDTDEIFSDFSIHRS